MIIITTDEEIAKFVSMTVGLAIAKFTDRDITSDDLIDFKDAAQRDIQLNYKKVNVMFESMIGDRFSYN
jgi:hypothetical protein